MQDIFKRSPTKIILFLELLLFNFIVVSCRNVNNLPNIRKAATRTLNYECNNMNQVRRLAFTPVFNHRLIQSSNPYAVLFKPHSPLFKGSTAAVDQCGFTTAHTRLFGSKRGTPGNPPGNIEIYNEQTTIPDLDIDKIKETITIIREIIDYPTYDVNLIITEDEQMQETNLETRGIDRPTDILSFQFQLYFCRWGFQCTCSLVTLPVSTVF